MNRNEIHTPRKKIFASENKTVLPYTKGIRVMLMAYHAHKAGFPYRIHYANGSLSI